MRRRLAGRLLLDRLLVGRLFIGSLFLWTSRVRPQKKRRDLWPRLIPATHTTKGGLCGPPRECLYEIVSILPE